MQQQDAALRWALRHGGQSLAPSLGKALKSPGNGEARGSWRQDCADAPPLRVILVCDFAQWTVLQALEWI